MSSEPDDLPPPWTRLRRLVQLEDPDLQRRWAETFERFPPLRVDLRRLNAEMYPGDDARKRYIEAWEARAARHAARARAEEESLSEERARDARAGRPARREGDRRRYTPRVPSQEQERAYRALRRWARPRVATAALWFTLCLLGCLALVRLGDGRVDPAELIFILTAPCALVALGWYLAALDWRARDACPRCDGKPVFLVGSRTSARAGLRSAGASGRFAVAVDTDRATRLCVPCGLTWTEAEHEVRRRDDQAPTAP